MVEIRMKNIEELNKKKNDILELEKRIKEVKEIKELKELQQEEIKLKNKIKKYSTYDSVQIGNIIAKLMTLFEGVEYYCSKNNLFFLNYDRYIIPKSNNENDLYIHPSYKIKNIKQERYPFDPSDKKDICYLSPSSFNPNTSTQYNSQNKDIEYIQLFIDYLYEKRSSKLLEEISEIELEEILQEFLKITNNLQQQRKIEIADKMEEQREQRRRKEFENSCVIDRKLIFNSLTYIMNHYEKNMSAIQEKEEEWSRSSQWSELRGYHKLTIQSGDEKVCFKTEIDSNGCYPDEEYCGVYIDINKNTNICFFDIKKTLLPVLKNSNYAIVFMNSIEEKYLEKQNITFEDIQQLLANITNKKKEKQRILKIKN